MNHQEAFDILTGPTEQLSAEPTGDEPKSAAEGIEDILGSPEEPQQQQGVEPEQIGPEPTILDEPVQPEGVQADQEPQTDEPVFEIEVNGEPVKLSRRELQEGYLRTADYTRKTQELANQRQEFEQQQTGFTQQREQYKTLVNALGERLQALQGQEPNWEELSRTDPAGYVQKKAAWDKRQSELQAVQHEQERLQGEEMQQRQNAIMGFVQQQKQAMLTARPELAEPEKSREFFTAVNNYAKSAFGFTDQELGGVLDHRMYLLAEKAMLFDQMQAKGQQVQQKVQSRPPLRPGASKRDVPQQVVAARKAKDRLERTGSTRDAAAMIESMLD